MFEDNEAVIKMIIKGRSPTMKHVSKTHKVALDWLFGRINLDPKIQIKYIDTKSQLADILTKGNFTRDECNHLLSCLNISHFSFTVCIAAIAKRAQQESGEERVTANQDLWWIWQRRCQQSCRVRLHQAGEDMLRISRSWDSCCGRWWSGQPDGLSPEGYSKSDYGRSWSSQEWKSEATAHDRSGKLDEISWNAMLDGNGQSAKYGEMIYDGSRQPDSANYQEEANSETFVMGGDAAEVVNKVKRPSAKQTEKNVERCRFLWRTFNNLVNVYGCDEECGDIHGKNFLSYSKFHHEFWRSHFEANVRYHRALGGRTRRD